MTTDAVDDHENESQQKTGEQKTQIPSSKQITPQLDLGTDLHNTDSVEGGVPPKECVCSELFVQHKTPDL